MPKQARRADIIIIRQTSNKKTAEGVVLNNNNDEIEYNEKYLFEWYDWTDFTPSEFNPNLATWL